MGDDLICQDLHADPNFLHSKNLYNGLKPIRSAITITYRNNIRASGSAMLKLPKTAAAEKIAAKIGC